MLLTKRMESITNSAFFICYPANKFAHALAFTISVLTGVAPTLVMNPFQPTTFKPSYQKRQLAFPEEHWSSSENSLSSSLKQTSQVEQIKLFQI